MTIRKTKAVTTRARATHARTHKRMRRQRWFPWKTQEFIKIWNEWTEYKKDQFGFRYKNPKSEQRALDNLYKISNQDLDTAKAIIIRSIVNGWKGLFQLQTDVKSPNNTNRAGSRYGNTSKKKYRKPDIED